MLNPQPRPEPRKRIKARIQRHAAKVVKSVREWCVERDGYCRVAAAAGYRVMVLLLECDGPSEWAHLGDNKRFKTRGKPAEERHTTAGSLMLCRKHHHDYDQGRLLIHGDNANAGLRFEKAK